MSEAVLCGITLEQLRATAAVANGVGDAARRLGVDQSWLRRVLAREGLRHLFPRAKISYGGVGVRSGIRAEDVAACRGMTKVDAAAALGVSVSQMSKLVAAFGLGALFPNRGEARWITERGYCNG